MTEKQLHKIELFNLTKISLNEWYAGVHWTKRKKIKDDYKLLIRGQYKKVFSKTNQYICSYEFGFKKQPLDSLNTVAMAKLIEDVIFEDDKYNIVLDVTLCSKKSTKDYVKIDVIELIEK